jgi:4-hydroxy-3-methylbut-2-enyl diphosphate reductase
VHIGPVATGPALIRGPKRTELAKTGVLAADMESAYLLAEIPPPRAVVRVVVDTVRYPLSHPFTVAAGLRAMRSLRLLSPALLDWAGMVLPSKDSPEMEV